MFRIGIADKRMFKAGRDRVSGIMRYAATRANWEVRLIASEGNACMANETPDLGQLDGLIGGPRMIAEHLHKVGRNVPFVTFSAQDELPPVNGVNGRLVLDDQDIGAAAAGVFIKGGLRHLAFAGVCYIAERLHQAERLAAFSRAAHDAGATCDVFVPPPGKVEADDLWELADWLAHLPHPCGVMAYADSRAQTVLDACRLARLRVPEQIQIIGVDNESEICENMQPTLTSVLPDFERGGFLAAQLLDDFLMRRVRPRQTVYRSYGVKSVVVRASTQDLKGGGRIVSQACEFIRLHAQERITVRDVAAHLNLARRTLEMRFREVLGRGVADVLRQERIDRVARLLRETDLSISGIAYDSGFASPTHLMAAFKQATGMTMRAWRADSGGRGG